MFDYLGSIPMWMQGLIIITMLFMAIIFFVIIIKLILTVIFKIRHAERIKAGIGGVEIEDVETKQEVVVIDKGKNKKNSRRGL